MLEMCIAYAAALAVIIAIYKIQHGKNKQSAHSADRSNDNNHNGDSSLRVRRTEGMDRIRQQSVEDRKIKGSYTLVEKSTGFKFDAWKIPDDRLSIYRLSNITGGNIQLLYTEGGMAAFVVYRTSSDSNWRMVNPGQILIYRPESGEFRVLDWETEKGLYHLEL